MSGYILVLDDDEIVRDLLTITLTSAGYAVEAVPTMDEALTLAVERPPRVVVFDLGLNGESGSEFVQAYRALPDSSASLVILSGATRIAERAAELAVERFLIKPYDLGTLLALVADAYQALPG
ncbi:MAG: response regulator [Chloroflexi bacterium]|nr:response regulator [Chloroflexota bacterium]